MSARNALEGLIHATKKTLEEAGDKASAEEKAAIEAAITEAEEAVKGKDKAAMEEATKKLTEASSSLAQKMYAEQAAQAQAGGDAGGAEQADDGVVDAEFEEVKEEEK